MVLVIAGPNGSGKSTVTQYLDVIGTYTNADDMNLLKRERIFVLTSNPYINVARVESRVAAGGHDVDKDTIIKRYYKSIDNIKKLMELCDILHVYDNTEDFVRIIRKHKDDISIFTNEYWDEERIMELV